MGHHTRDSIVPGNFGLGRFDLCEFSVSSDVKLEFSPKRVDISVFDLDGVVDCDFCYVFVPQSDFDGSGLVLECCAGYLSGSELRLHISRRFHVNDLSRDVNSSHSGFEFCDFQCLFSRYDFSGGEVASH